MLNKLFRSTLSKLVVKRRCGFVRTLLIVFLTFLQNMVFVVRPVFAASSPWVQLDWVGGSGQTSWLDSTGYSSATNIDSSVANQITLQQVGTSWYNATWSYRKKITFDNNAQAEALSDFTVLVKLTSSNFNFSKAKTSGEDIRFTDSDGTTPLNYEIESWSNSSQEAWIWVKVPQIDASSDTDFIYMYYGNTDAEDAQNSTSTWDDNYVGVWHLKETAGNYIDSSQNDNDSTAISGLSRDSSSKINGGPLFNKANGDYINFGDKDSLEPAAITVEAWVKTNDYTLGTNGGIAKGYVFPGGAEASYSLDFASNQATWRLNNTSDVTFGSRGQTIGDNNFHYWVGQYTGSASILYKDAVASSTSVTDTIDYTKTYNDFAIGGRYGSGSHYSTDGYIDEVRVSNIARSDKWVAAQYKSMNETFNTYGIEEQYSSTSTGNLVSSILDTEQQSDWGILTYSATSPSNTSVEVRVRTSNNASMSGATAFSSCSAIDSGTDVSENSCVTDSHRYVQYQVTLNNTDLTSTPTFTSFSLSFATSSLPEQRAVWLQDDSDLDNKLTALKNAHFNTVYFGVWGATNLGLQEVIDRIHQHGMEAHIWEANAYICAGQRFEACTNQSNTSWFARLPNGMDRSDWSGESDWLDFGVPAARQNVVNYMVDYASNYDADGVHYDYIRYDYKGNWSFSQENLDLYQTQYGVAPEVVRGDQFPAFSGRVAANRLTTLTTATSLVQYQDAVPAIFVNDRGNGQVLTFNTQAYDMYAKVFDTVLQRAVEQYGSNDIYVLSHSVNSGEYGGYNLTSRWLTYLGYSPQQTTIAGINSLPAGSLLVVPAVYSFTDQTITDMDTLLTNGGDIIFIDGPTTSAASSATFRSILGTSTGNSYFPAGKALFSVSSGAENHSLVTGLDRGDGLSFAQASTYIDNWKSLMQGTITDTVKAVSDVLRVSKPDVKISAAVFPVEDGGNTLNVHQNWPVWINNSYVDYAIIMGYTLNSSTFTSRINWITTNDYQNRTMLGLGPYLMTSCGETQTILDQIHEIRTNNIRGYSLFQSNNITQAGQVAADCEIMDDLTTLQSADVDAYYPSLPYIPSTLAQFKSDGITVVGSGEVTNQNSVVIKFDMTSPDLTDSLTPQIEIQPSNVAFTNSVTTSGDIVAYAGSPVIGSVEVTGLSDGSSYHWQARVSNATGNSTWLASGGIPDFIIDTTPPILTSITISDTDGFTTDTTPTITLISSGTPSQVAFSCNGGTNYSDWITYSETISSFDITNGATGCTSSLGTKIITAKTRDAVGNESTSSSDSTIYDTSAPTVTSISPSNGKNNATARAVTITGTNFAPGATVTLTKSGQTTITASSVSVNSDTSISAVFNLKNQNTGAYTLTVTNTDNDSGSYNYFTIKKHSSGGSGSSSKSKSSNNNSSSSPSGPITLNKVNNVTIGVLQESSNPWNTYYSSSSQPWFYGTGTTNGTKVEVFSWYGKSLCKATVAGGVWACMPANKMEIKTHRIDIKYGSKFLPPFNLRIGGYYYPASPPIQTIVSSPSPNIQPSPATVRPNPFSVFSKYLTPVVKGAQDSRNLNFLNLKTILLGLVGVLLVGGFIRFLMLKLGKKI